MNKKRVKLNVLIEDFLSERRKSDGGWAPVTESDFRQLCAIIDRILELKWGRDADGDLPIEYKIIDRKQFERMHYVPVPYQHKDAAEHLEAVIMNAQMATDALSATLRIIRYESLHKERRA